MCIFQEAFVSADEFGSDLEHVEVLQRKFDEFQKDMAAQEYRVTEVYQLAERLVLEGHPERETIVKRKDVCYLKSKMRFFKCEIGYNTIMFSGIKRSVAAPPSNGGGSPRTSVRRS